jgi:hypothetical protein
MSSGVITNAERIVIRPVLKRLYAAEAGAVRTALKLDITMPPKDPIVYGKNFHFYREAREQNYVYLELEDAPYEACYLRVMVVVPVDVWETIRNLGATGLDLGRQTNQQGDKPRRRAHRRIYENSLRRPRKA